MAKKAITLPGNVKMPVIGLGTSKVKDPEELERAIETAFECGYRHFDTAYVYKNEQILGKVIAGWIEKGLVKRKDLFITSKLPMYGVHPKRVKMFLDKSLKNLGLDYVDLYLIHFPVCSKYEEENDNFLRDDEGAFLTEPTDHIAVWKKMEEMVDAGKVKNIGVSNFNCDQIAKILDKARIKPSNLQIEIHPYLQNEELVEFCKEKGVSVVAHSPLASPGLHLYFQQAGFPSKESPRVMDDDVIISIAKKYSRSPAQIILRYAIQRGLAAIPKSTNPSRIKENIDIFDFELDKYDLIDLEKLDKGKNGRVCGLEFKGLLEHAEYPYQ